VASYSSRSTPLAYKVSALYGGQDGSLLFWAFMLACFLAVVVVQNRRRLRALMPLALAVGLSVALFFLLVLVFFANPFSRLPVPPADGRGLNPLLQNPGMFFHPPTLYIGYVGFTIPYAFAMAALLTARLDAAWIRATRRWTIFSWFFLMLGNMFGAWWAYRVLGWGGYWGWDPVENASFMPWLTGTAYLHSVMIQEKKGMLKVWNLVLIILTFALSIFGTFLTRSGVLSSVHTFAQSSLGPLFLAFLGLILAVSLALLIFRLPALRSASELESFLSRESSFLFNNLMLVGIAFTVFWGTVFPLIAEAVQGTKVTVGAPYYNQVMLPIGLVLLFITGVCPIIAWRRASWPNVRRNFLTPAGAAIAGSLLIWLLGLRHRLALLTLTLLVFVATTILLEFVRGARARRESSGEPFPRALLTLINRNRRRYGGYLVHLGLLLIVLAIAGEAFKVEQEAYLKPGETVTVGRYLLRYEGQAIREEGGTTAFGARMAVFNGGEPLGVLVPEKRFHPGSEQPHTQVAIYGTLREDLYLIPARIDREGAAIRALVNPLMMWMWIGTWVIGGGTLIVMWPDARERRLARSLDAGRGDAP
jgi:cytochrome c-type biogenesis protein CcmF